MTKMGADFVEKATKSFKRSWDRAKVALSTADLFTRQPDDAPRTVAADIVNGADLDVGVSLVVEGQDGMLIARRGNDEVARVTDAPSSILQAVTESCGLAKGTVETVHPIARVVEISLC